jgi:hypothetical protein
MVIRGTQARLNASLIQPMAYMKKGSPGLGMVMQRGSGMRNGLSTVNDAILKNEPRLHQNHSQVGFGRKKRR